MSADCCCGYDNCGCLERAARLTALEAKCDLWAASCKKAERERDALKADVERLWSTLRECRVRFVEQGMSTFEIDHLTAALSPKADTTAINSPCTTLGCEGAGECPACPKAAASRREKRLRAQGFEPAEASSVNAFAHGTTGAK